MNSKSEKYLVVNQDLGQLKQLLRDFILTRKGETHTAVTLAQLMKRRYGLSIDWQEFTYQLEYLAYHDKIDFIEYTVDRFARYLI